MREVKKISLRNKLILKSAGYKHTVIDKESMEIELTINNRNADNPMFLDLVTFEIIKALGNNGADVNIDYSLEVPYGTAKKY